MLYVEWSQHILKQFFFCQEKFILLFIIPICNQDKILSINTKVGLVNFAVCLRILDADVIGGGLREPGILGETGPVHQVEDVAVVGARVSDALSLGDAVALYVPQRTWSTTATTITSRNTHVDFAASVVVLQLEGEPEVVDVALDGGRVGAERHQRCADFVIAQPLEISNSNT